jgi:hypothetical protein
MNFPELYHLRQKIDSIVLEDIEGVLEEGLVEKGLLDKVKPGARVVVGAGSRGIPNYVRVMRKLVELLEARGAQVSILPMMGSHGGGTGPGQVHVLRELGITPETVGAPIIDTMDVVPFGETPSTIPIVVDKNLSQCDHILMVNRVKVHTEFHGRIESGLLKMMAVGFGRYQGAVITHKYAVALGYERSIREIAHFYMERLPVLAGVAMVDGPDNQTARIEVLLPEDFERMEEQLLDYARSISIKLPLEEIDILLVDQIGKNVSGAGMDTKVIGRMMNVYEKELESPRITRIIVRDLTPETYGNAIGIGLADFTTQRCVDKIDIDVTCLNCITAIAPEKARIPITLSNDKEALEAAFRTIGPKDKDSVRLVWIRNTSSLMDFMASPAVKVALFEEGIEVVDGPVEMAFDRQANLISPWGWA